MAFGNARFRKCLPGLQKRDLAKSRRKFKLKLRKLRKRSKEHVRNLKEVRPEAGEYVPISLARHAVLRSLNRVNVEVMLAFRRLFNTEQSLLNEMIAAFDDDSIYDNMELVRMALQTGAEERLKTTAQIAGVFPMDSGFDNGGVQAIFEQFYDEHGLPNAAEKALLSRVGNLSLGHVDRFFTAKESRLVAARALEGQMRLSMLRNLDADTFTQPWKPKKPFWRH